MANCVRWVGLCYDFEITISFFQYLFLMLSIYLQLACSSSIRPLDFGNNLRPWNKIPGQKENERYRGERQACIVGKIVKSRVGWAGDVVRMNDRLPKIAETKKEKGHRKRGRPQLR